MESLKGLLLEQFYLTFTYYLLATLPESPTLVFTAIQMIHSYICQLNLMKLIN